LQRGWMKQAPTNKIMLVLNYLQCSLKSMGAIVCHPVSYAYMKLVYMTGFKVMNRIRRFTMIAVSHAILRGNDRRIVSIPALQTLTPTLGNKGLKQRRKFRVIFTGVTFEEMCNVRTCKNITESKGIGSFLVLPTFKL